MCQILLTFPEDTLTILRKSPSSILLELKAKDGSLQIVSKTNKNGTMQCSCILPLLMTWLSVKSMCICACEWLYKKRNRKLLVIRRRTIFFGKVSQLRCIWDCAKKIYGDRNPTSRQWNSLRLLLEKIVHSTHYMHLYRYVSKYYCPQSTQAKKSYSMHDFIHENLWCVVWKMDELYLYSQ